MLTQVDHLALLDLLADESPLECVLRLLGRSVEPKPCGTAAAERGNAEDQTVFFAIRIDGAQDRRRVIDSLRRNIPAELVEDILVDGRSWDAVE